MIKVFSDIGHMAVQYCDFKKRKKKKNKQDETFLVFFHGGTFWNEHILCVVGWFRGQSGEKL